jgi:hypothetical protein
MLRIQLFKPSKCHCVINKQLFIIPKEYIGRGLSCIIWAWGNGKLKLLVTRRKIIKSTLRKQRVFTDKQVAKFIRRE